jgi:hypothetical protein
VFVNVFPNAEFGIATIWDADILIWAASHMNSLRKQGKNDLPRTLTFQPYDLLKTIGRLTGGHQYQLLRESLGRLQATSIVTNIRVPKGKKHRQFSWIESWTDNVDGETQQSRGMSLTLSDWFYEGILMDGGLLSIDPVYFNDQRRQPSHLSAMPLRVPNVPNPPARTDPARANSLSTHGIGFTLLHTSAYQERPSAYRERPMPHPLAKVGQNRYSLNTKRACASNCVRGSQPRQPPKIVEPPAPAEVTLDAYLAMGGRKDQADASERLDSSARPFRR